MSTGRPIEGGFTTARATRYANEHRSQPRMIERVIEGVMLGTISLAVHAVGGTSPAAWVECGRTLP